MRIPSINQRPQRREPPRRSRSRSGSVRRSGPAETSDSQSQISHWIDAVAGLLNDPDPNMRERGLDELRRGLEVEPAVRSVDTRDLLVTVLDAAAHGALGSQPEVHILLAGIQQRRTGDRAGIEKSLWLATFGAARLAASNLPAHRDRAAQVNRAASRIWGELGNAYQRDARNAIGRYFTARLAHPVAALPVLRAWPDAGHDEGSERRQPSMGPPQPEIQKPAILKGPNSRPGDTVPPRMSGVAVGRMSALDVIHALGALVGVLRRASVLASYLRECQSARARRDLLPTPGLPSDVREFEASLDSALRNPNLPPEQRLMVEQLAASLDLGFMLEASLAYWGTGR